MKKARGFVGIAAMFLAIICIFFTACEPKSVIHRAFVLKFNLSENIIHDFVWAYGTPCCYEFHGATSIDVSTSDSGVIILNDYEKDIDWDDYDGYEICEMSGAYYERKIVRNGNVFNYDKCDSLTYFFWAPNKELGNWNYDLIGNISDYVKFVARKGEKVVGYAVLYVWINAGISGGEVLKNTQCNKMSQKKAYELIEEIITEHKNSQEVEGG